MAPSLFNQQCCPLCTMRDRVEDMVVIFFVQVAAATVAQDEEQGQQMQDEARLRLFAHIYSNQVAHLTTGMRIGGYLICLHLHAGTKHPLGMLLSSSTANGWSNERQLLCMICCAFTSCSSVSIVITKLGLSKMISFRTPKLQKPCRRGGGGAAGPAVHQRHKFVPNLSGGHGGPAALLHGAGQRHWRKAVGARKGLRAVRAAERLLLLQPDVDGAGADRLMCVIRSSNTIL